MWTLFEALSKHVCQEATEEKYLRIIPSQLLEDGKDLILLLPHFSCLLGDEVVDHREK